MVDWHLSRSYLLKLQILSATFWSQPQRKFSWTGTADVPIHFCFCELLSLMPFIVFGLYRVRQKMTHHAPSEPWSIRPPSHKVGGTPLMLHFPWWLLTNALFRIGACELCALVVLISIDSTRCVLSRLLQALGSCSKQVGKQDWLSWPHFQNTNQSVFPWVPESCQEFPGVPKTTYIFH